jgi:hypothetical protein
MMRNILLLACLAVLTGCGNANVRIDRDAIPSDGVGRTYRWMQPPTRDIDVAMLVRSPDLDETVMAAVDETLASKGYVKAQRGEADFLVGYAAVIRREMRGQTLDSYYRYRRQPTVYSGYDYADATRQRVYDEGTLVLDVADAGGGEPLWRASARAEIHPGQDTTTRRRRIQQAVTEMLAQFPEAPPPAR